MVRLVILRFLESYFRHRWLYLIPIVIMSIVGGLTLFTTSKYTARGVIFIQGESLLGSLTSVRNDGFGFQTPAQATTEELYELLATDAFIRSLVLETSLEEAMSEGQSAMGDAFQEVRETIWIEPRGESQIVIFASHEDPELAFQLVGAAIESYIQWQINLDLSESRVAEEFFKELTDSYQIDLDKARSEMGVYLTNHPDPPQFQSRPATESIEIDRLQANINMAATRLTNALSKLEDARLATKQTESNVRQSYLLIDAPLLPESPETSLKDIALTAAIFVVLGIMISGVAVVGSALLDRSFHFPIDVYHTLELPVLTTVPEGFMDDLTIEDDEEKSEVVVHQDEDVEDDSPSTGMFDELADQDMDDVAVLDVEESNLLEDSESAVEVESDDEGSSEKDAKVKRVKRVKKAKEDEILVAD